MKQQSNNKKRKKERKKEVKAHYSDIIVELTAKLKH